MPDPSPPSFGSRHGPIRADLDHVRAAEAGRRRAIWLGVGLGALLAVLFAGLWIWKLAFSDLPPIPDKAALWSLNRPAGAAFVDRDGKVIGQRGPRHGSPLTLAALPPYLPQAFLAAEDRRFYHHGGLDLWGVARAACCETDHC